MSGSRPNLENGTVASCLPTPFGRKVAGIIFYIIYPWRCGSDKLPQQK